MPLLRGLGRFGESLLVLALVKTKLPQAELPLEGGRVAGALVGAAAATSAVKTLAPKSALVQEAGLALAAFVPAVLALKNSAISGYHGAEHKVIGGREATLRCARREAADRRGRPCASASSRHASSSAIRRRGQGARPLRLEPGGSLPAGDCRHQSARPGTLGPQVARRVGGRRGGQPGRRPGGSALGHPATATPSSPD